MSGCGMARVGVKMKTPNERIEGLEKEVRDLTEENRQLKKKVVAAENTMRKDAIRMKVTNERVDLVIRQLNEAIFRTI